MNDRRQNFASLADVDSIVRVAAAMASGDGGEIWIGVDDAGLLYEVPATPAAIERLSAAIRTQTEPPQNPSINSLVVEGNTVLKIRVSPSAIKPVFVSGTAYARRNGQNVAMSRQETQQLMEATTGQTWDRLTSLDVQEDDLDPLLVADYARRAEFGTVTQVATALQSLGFSHRGAIVNGAALLFGREPQGLVPAAWVQCARFAGTESIDFLDQERLGGTVIQQIENAIAFVRKHTHRSIEFVGDAERVETPDYPERGLREAIVNAICHRDYSVNGHVTVRLYDDRIEVWNPGSLPPTLGVDDLYLEHPSFPRNPALANALFRVRMIEQWGSGTLRMVQEAERQSLPRPEFESVMGSFRVRFWRAGAPDRRLRKLTARQSSIAALVAAKDGIGASDLMAAIGIGKSQLALDLGVLVEAGVVRREGRGPATMYFSAHAVSKGRKS